MQSLLGQASFSSTRSILDKLYLCVDPNGVAYRNSPAMDDRCEDGAACMRDQSVEAAEVMRASSVDGAAAWIKAKHNGKWLPAVKEGDILFRHVTRGSAVL